MIRFVNIQFKHSCNTFGMEFYTSLLGARKSCTTEGRRFLRFLFLRFLRLTIASFWLFHFGSKFYLEKVHILARCTQGIYQSQSPQPNLCWGRQSHFHVINSCDFTGQESRIFLIIHCILILCCIRKSNELYVLMRSRIIQMHRFGFEKRKL